MESKTFQTFGIPGWISLMPGPTVEWIPREGDKEELSIVIDERLCCSTLLRAERLSATTFVVADMLYLNGRYIWDTHTFAQRSKWLFDLLEEFHTKELGHLLHKDSMETVPVRGWEYYSNTPGMVGSYVPLPPMVPMKWSPTEQPDIWKNATGVTFRVRSLEEMKRLRKNPIVPSRILEGRVEILAS